MKPVPGLSIEQQPEKVVCALALCGEARNQGREGMEAVMHVGVNRTLSPHKRFGATLKDVFLRPYAFSCFLPSDPNRGKLLDLWETEAPAYALAESVVEAVLAGQVPSPVGPATHYCTKALWGHDDSDRIASGHHPAWYSKQMIESGATLETCLLYTSPSPRDA